MLRSINLPQGLLQANMVERIQQTQQQHPDMQQRYFEGALARERKRAEESVNDTHRTEQEAIRREGRPRDQRKNSPGGEGGETAADQGITPLEPAEDDEVGRVVNVKV